MESIYNVKTAIMGANSFRFKAEIEFDGRKIAEVTQHFNPFVLKYSMTILPPEPPIDRRLLIAAGILLAGIERRQQ